MIPGASTLLRTLLIYSLCIPLAIFVGYVITDPLNTSSFVEMGLVLGFLLLPLLLKWHREILLIFWNFGAILFFLPGRPEAWLGLAWISFTIAVVQYILNPRQKFLVVPSIARPLLFLVLVAIATAFLRGGVGLYAFGSAMYGGKKYFLILTAVVGFFALTSRPIPPRRAAFWVVVFLLASATAIVGDLAGVLGSSFFYVYLFLPLGEYGFESVASDLGVYQAPSAIARMGGVAAGSAAVLYAMLARYGVHQIFASRKILRLGLFLLLVTASMLGGFRSVLILFALTFGIVFYLEGSFRTRLMPVFVVLAFILTIGVLGFSERMPLNIQRTISFLPVKVDPVVKLSAEVSTEWRIGMWKDVIPEIPRYLLLGKGLAFSGTELEALTTSKIGGRDSLSTEGAELAGDYHSGPLSIIIPFGIWGVIGFVWFIGASLRALYRNYKFGHPFFKTLNTFLFAYFLAKTISFFLIFGSLYSDLSSFTGIIALSIAVNRGVARPFLVPSRKLAAPIPLRIHPARQPAAGVASHA
jgi:hypothetical protein